MSETHPREAAVRALRKLINEADQGRGMGPAALAVALVEQAGVKVDVELWAMGEGTMPEPALSLPNYCEPTHRRVVIALPFEPVEATRA